MNRVLVLIFLVFASVFGSSQSSGSAPNKNSVPEKYSLIPSLDKSLMDSAADPCTDFYQYACGNWGKLYPVPADSPYSGQFYNLDQYNHQVRVGSRRIARRQYAKDWRLLRLLHG